MREHKQSRIILSLLLGLILLACLPICAFADTSELSDGDEAGISLSTTVPPSVVSGGGAAYTKGGASGLIFTTDDTKDNLLRVLVDGKVVSTENYTVSGDPLAITLHPDFLDTLSAGEHIIEIVTESGSSSAAFRIETPGTTAAPSASPGPSIAPAATATPAAAKSGPRTGDDSPILPWACMLFVCAAGLTAVLVYRKSHCR